MTSPSHDLITTDSHGFRDSLFRQLAEGMPQIVYITGADGRTEFFNHAWTEFTGLTNADSEILAQAIHPDDLPVLAREWAESMAKGTTLTCEFRLRRQRDGAYRWFLTRAIPVRDAQGVLLRWFGTSTDIHDTRLAGVALAETNRRKDEFLATLSHELRNPLAPIRNALSILQLRQHDTQTTWAIGLIDRQVQQLTRLIDDLLDVSRIGSGKMELRFTAASVANIVQRAVETCQPLVAERAHQLEVGQIDTSLTVWGDADRLAQVCFNLLHNAAKYSDAGSLISIAAEASDDAALISVRDTGVGIEPDRIGSVFDMYTQIEESRDISRGGLGVGLSLVKRIVELHGGTVAVTSDGKGRGSEFRIRLPRHPAPSA